MSPEIHNVKITISDFGKEEIWRDIIMAFEKDHDIVQEIKFSDGPLVGEGFMMSMHEEPGGGGYYQIECVSNTTLETIFMNWCMENGEILPVGIYRFPFKPGSEPKKF